MLRTRVTRETMHRLTNVDHLLILRGLAALGSELAETLGDAWPAFKAMMADTSMKIATASESEQARLIDELLDIGLASPAAKIFRRVLVGSASVETITIGMERTRY